MILMGYGEFYLKAYDSFLKPLDVQLVVHRNSLLKMKSCVANSAF